MPNAKEFTICVGYDDFNEICWCRIDYDNLSKEELALLERAVRFWKREHKKDLK